jgi:lipoate-protein ligase B
MGSDGRRIQRRARIEHQRVEKAYLKPVTNSANECWVVDLGRMGYEPACELQRRAVEARKVGTIADVLLLCEHPHVITLGRNGRLENLRASDNVLRQMRVEFHPSDRGGDITYHGPGQIVGYPILDLASHRRDVRMVRRPARRNHDSRNAGIRY